MNIRTIATYGIELTVVLILAALVLGQLFATPVLFGYVTTDSMAPTLAAGDGYIAIPAAIAGPVEEGDVVTFEAQELHGGGLTTHRIVAKTDEGYITKGDANPFTDQDDGEPPVTDGQITAKALQVNGEVVAIPQLGTTVMTIRTALETIQVQLAALVGTSTLVSTQGLAYLTFGFGAMLLLWSVLEGRGRRTRETRSRDRSRKQVYNVRVLVLAAAVLLCLATVGTMAVTSGTEEYGIISAEYESDQPNVIQQGETEAVEFPIQNSGILPIVTILEPASNGVDIQPREHYLEHGERAEATLSITTPPATGYYVRSVAEYRYFAVLPHSVILALHAIHPWVAMTVVTGILLLLFMLPIVAVIGSTGRIRTRERNRDSPTKMF